MAVSAAAGAAGGSLLPHAASNANVAAVVSNSVLRIMGIPFRFLLVRIVLAVKPARLPAMRQTISEPDASDWASSFLDVL